jgi:Protein of unknown function (DUF2933)
MKGEVLVRCLDRRVLIGLAGLGLAVLVVRPQWLGAAVPLLVVLACPLSMLLMMRRGASSCATNTDSAADLELAGLRTEIARLRAEVQDGRARRDA